MLTNFKIIVIIRYQKKGDKQMKNYLFYDEVTGEEFIVETDCRSKAILCARTYFEEPRFCGEISYWEAEMMGLDTY